jgi:hypothetical protein
VGNDYLTRRRWLKTLSRRLPFRPMLRFIYSYIFRGGFLDGHEGYIFCRLLSIYEFLSVAKLKELRISQTDRPATQAVRTEPPPDVRPDAASPGQTSQAQGDTPRNG